MSVLGLDDKKGHIAALIKLAKADGEISQGEVDLIKLIAIHMGVTSNEFNDIVQHADTITVFPPNSQEEKERYLFNIFSLMKIDLKADVEETRICEELGLRLGYGVQELKKVSIYMRAKINEVVDFEEFKTVLKG